MVASMQRKNKKNMITAPQLFAGTTEQADNKYVKRLLVSVRDLADMIIVNPLRERSGKPARRYSPEEIAELKNSGKVVGRTYNSYKVKAHRLGLSLRELRAHVVCAERMSGIVLAE